MSARIVGVSSDIAHTDRTSAPPPRVYLPLTERSRRLSYVIRAGDPSAITPGIRSTVASTAAAVPIDFLETLDESLRQAASSDYVIIGALTGFALLALLLASAGLFGVISYGVAQRTAEFGTRMALGASAGDVVRLVARQSLTFLAIGVAIGLSVGIAIGFMMAGSMPGVSPLDPLSLGAVLALLTVVTLLATAIPAWRAAHIDPVVALRAE
jgi:ABC-type antimicrobial peptide transport system permease subunit